MKFKVGDKVKFVNNLGVHGSHVKLNEIFKIINIDSYENNIMPYHAKNEIGYCQWFKEEELEKVDYSYEDLKKSPIGTKITFKNEEVMTKCCTKRYENASMWRYENDLVNLEDKSGVLGKIIKIEEPTYTTVYEAKKEILDDAEKRYLKGVIRPFKNKVKCIKKFVFPTGSAIIQIEIKRDNCICHMHLPPFEKNAMYKNMEDNKNYTLEELGL